MWRAGTHPREEEPRKHCHCSFHLEGPTTRIQFSQLQQGRFHKKLIVFLPSPSILCHLENPDFTESSSRAVLFCLFLILMLLLLFFWRRTRHTRGGYSPQVVVAKWYVLRLTIRQPRGEELQEPVPVQTIVCRWPM